MIESTEFDKIYGELMNRLEKDERPHLELSDDVLNQIKNLWTNALETQDNQRINSIMCVLDYTRHTYDLFDDHFYQTLESTLSHTTLVFTLGASWKHMLGRWSRSGDRITMRYIEILRTFLNSKNHELVEWSLRTIDQIGPQGRLLQKEIAQNKMKLKSLINPRAKAITQLVEMFEKRWSHHGR
ncbi:MAG: hypothetical protein COW01_03280 [Bdellovibrionales bacterium CG12_big_fil_rev_8_21_14_0_65_38_15]|nr:MAG: hypothetical protein COW79_12520 [Bdellovibrionales bacterium CG22_combo_CG10-13_8_21_14_all_38_13]PIQ56867.1 MAG: hypothetical protein COW01_03280 [Bdellovibrionales bacterium CG12_big_fil_rev_8_21_14_0_65_38_15]PIR30032.1 MAG: hypothetical protein COV38_07000 [Bdellovibrionales bacterium CG11_big_fil_rev_8_21_14_0_20_38_13]